MNRLVIGVLAGLLIVSGCSPSAMHNGGEVATKQAPPSSAELQQRMAGIPGGTVVSLPGRLELRFADGTLFARDAVLPLPGGRTVLEPLTALLHDFPQLDWQVLVAASTGNGPDYDQRLAEKRSELLHRYLQRYGVTPARMETVSDGSREEPLTLVYLLPAGGSSSSTVKE